MTKISRKDKDASLKRIFINYQAHLKSLHYALSRALLGYVLLALQPKQLVAQCLAAPMVEHLSNVFTQVTRDSVLPNNSPMLHNRCDGFDGLNLDLNLFYYLLKGKMRPE